MTNTVETNTVEIENRRAAYIELLTFLAANGVEMRRQDTGAIGLPSGDLAFVSITPKGKLVLMHPPKGGRAEPYYQRFTHPDRLLAAICKHTPLAAICECNPLTVDPLTVKGT